MREIESKYLYHPILITGRAGVLGSHMVALCLEKSFLKNNQGIFIFKKIANVQ